MWGYRVVPAKNQYAARHARNIISAYDFHKHESRALELYHKHNILRSFEIDTHHTRNTHYLRLNKKILLRVVGV